MAKTIGEVLKEARLAQEISIADVAKETHIRVKYIEALENNQLDALPSSVQGRGFLRLYADMLKLPPDPLLAAWESGMIDQIQLFTQTDSSKSVSGNTASNYSSTEIVFSDQQGTALVQESSRTVSTPKEDRKLEKVSRKSRQEKADETIESSEIFLEIGQTLKQQRETLGLSLNDIEHYTHIRMFYLQAIEAGRMHELPSPTQGKGMIESYAKFLDIDFDSLMFRFADGLQMKREEQSQKNVDQIKRKQDAEKSNNQPVLRKLISPDLLIGSIVILALVVFAVWSTSKIIANRNLIAQETIPAISEMLASTASNTAQPDTIVSTPLATASLPASTQDIGTDTSSTASSVTLSGTTITTEITFNDNLPLQVYIVARQRTYLRVIVDDQTEYDGRITPGNAMPFSGNEKIEILTGNAAALQILFNQNDLGTIGSFGQVVDLILTQQGIITPTPRFTPTATQTIPSTVTLEPTATPETPTITPLVP